MKTSRIFLFLCITIVVAAAGLYIANRPGKAPVVQKPIETPAVSGPRDATYTIEGVKVTLKDGKAEMEDAPGSASKTLTTYFGNEAKGDLNGDGKEDIAFILSQTSSGSGHFYYLAAALKSDEGYTGTNALFLGDRVAPMPTDIRAGIAIANYAIRKEGEPMATQPSVGASTYAKIVNGSLVAVEKPE